MEEKEDSICHFQAWSYHQITKYNVIIISFTNGVDESSFHVVSFVFENKMKVTFAIHHERREINLKSLCLVVTLQAEACFDY